MGSAFIDVFKIINSANYFIIFIELDYDVGCVGHCVITRLKLKVLIDDFGASFSCSGTKLHKHIQPGRITRGGKIWVYICRTYFIQRTLSLFFMRF